MMFPSRSGAEHHTSATLQQYHARILEGGRKQAISLEGSVFQKSICVSKDAAKTDHPFQHRRGGGGVRARLALPDSARVISGERFLVGRRGSLPLQSCVCLCLCTCVCICMSISTFVSIYSGGGGVRPQFGFPDIRLRFALPEAATFVWKRFPPA